MTAAATDFTNVTPDKKLQWKLHPGQWRAWCSLARVVLVLAGTQGGKTSFGPMWLYREITLRGPGDYLVAAPTFPLLELKLLPEFKRLFESQLGLGRYVASPTRKFVFSKAGEVRVFGKLKKDEERPPTQIFFGHAQDPDSLESATAKGAWLDEAGQKKFKQGSYQAIRRRLAIWQGRILLTTTPYTLGWLKLELHDKAKKPNSGIEVINFKSIDNPSFPREEYEWARENLPLWKFNMFYNGIFEKPAGLIYDCWDPILKVPAFTIPDEWPRFAGLDFGAVNTAAVLVARDPASGNCYVYREYHAGGRTAKEHRDHILKLEPRTPQAFGGAQSEGNWRLEFRQAGLPVREPLVTSVEVGIQRVYGLFKTHKLYVFDTCTDLLVEIGDYSRVLDDNDEPTEEIEDKAHYHRLDALRYVGTHLGRDTKTWGAKSGTAG